MKTLVIAVLLALVCVPTQEVSATTNSNANSHVVFYVPHQDDDLLTMGVGIRNHIKGGHNVHVVMLTDGAASGVRTKMGMTKEAFTKARNKEFELAMKALGVNSNNLEYRMFQDGKLTINQVKSVISEYETLYPNAKHKSYSYTDSHVDHKNSGLALKQMVTSGDVTDARFYVRRGTAVPSGKRLTTERYKVADKSVMIAASAAYKRNRPWTGYYGIGYRSVKQSFITFDKLPQSRYHK